MYTNIFGYSSDSKNMYDTAEFFKKTYIFLQITFCVFSSLAL